MENISNKRKYNLSPFDHVFSRRNCRGGIYFSWCVLKVTGHSSFFFCIRAVALVRVFIWLTWFLHWSCWRTATALREGKKKTLPLLSLNENVSLREEEIPWYKSFRSSISILEPSPPVTRLLYWHMHDIFSRVQDPYRILFTKIIYNIFYKCENLKKLEEKKNIYKNLQ